MSQTALRIAVLRAALRCSRHRREVTREALLLRVDCSDSELGAVLAQLARDGLVRGVTDSRLTMEGLAVAVATIRPVAVAPQVQRARSAA
jgi:hypothetical protein